MTQGTDILVLGATGFAGKLVTRYLDSHPSRQSFTFAVAARSESKLAALADELHLSAQVPRRRVDVTRPEEVEAAVRTAKVVVNTVGPFWTWGTPVVSACAKHGIHYVDSTGEAHWVKDIITEFDFTATQTHAIIVPCSGYDSVLSDLSAFFSVQTLKAHLGPDTKAGQSVSSHALRGAKFSGGTLSTIYTALTTAPREKLRAARNDHVLSPAPTSHVTRPKLLYALPKVRPSVHGGFFLMSSINKTVVQRSRGLFELQNVSAQDYGRSFTYDEFLKTKGRLGGLLISVLTFSASILLATIPLARWLFKRYVVDRTHGPSESEMQNASLTLTNVTSSADIGSPVWAKTTIKCRGDPGYLNTAVMLGEGALALLDTSALPPLAQIGGILTPATAYGDILRRRLEDSGRFEFHSEILQ